MFAPAKTTATHRRTLLLLGSLGLLALAPLTAIPMHADPPDDSLLNGTWERFTWSDLGTY